MTSRRRFVAAVIAYGVAIAAGVSLVTALEPAPTWVGALVALTASVPATGMVLAGPLQLRRQDGVERSILLWSTSLAFFVTMTSSLTYGLLEAFARVLEPSASWAYSIGMGTWLASSLVLQRRLS
jgi:hypothetical protein